MEQRAPLVKHIESFVDSSTSPAQQLLVFHEFSPCRDLSVTGQAENVKAIASLLKNDVREMELYLTTTDHILRARGEVLVHLQVKPLDDATIHTLVEFFTEKLTDWRALRGALVGCLALLRRKSNAGVVTRMDAETLTKSYLENLQVQSLGQQDRKLCFELLECLLDCYPEAAVAQGDHLVYGICEAIEGEKDPYCLMHAFHIVEVLARTFPDPAGPVASIAEDLFDIIGRYFPIHYTYPKSEDLDVSRDDLSRALMLRSLQVGPRICRRRTTFAGHRWATQKPPRRASAPISRLSSLRRETGHELRSWLVKFGCLEWSSEGCLKSGGLWVSGSRRPPLRRLSGEASGLCRSRGWVRRNFLLPAASFGGGFRPPANFPAAGVSPESFLFISSGTISPVLSFGAYPICPK
ncbi:hypothetical protein Cgig2_015792 [Carnegiea gigantea]|uniref:MMS19 nucleotide excision repair protein n=1 Tax=Carnegiea gigantea TaxID=171969 RepID=A0A9Q1QJ10_9CARY|nr:hypothetical protein Cgig2_015792 [Carnegiea gigantea]